ncbi:MAG: polysaccharide deacetylase family protein [Promethearchaeota archaeon]
MCRRIIPFLGIDIDRDAPFPHLGVSHAVSLPLKPKIKDLTDPEQCFTYFGTITGLEGLIPILKDYSIPTVFFFEGRALEQFRDNEKNLLKRISDQSLASYGIHGYDHEDLLGKDSGVPLTEKEQQNIFTTSKNHVQTILKKSADGFRAPYTRITSSSLNILEKLDFKFDSSLYSRTSTIPSPYQIGQLWEIPIIQIPNGPSFYLWALFERKRNIQNILNILKSLTIQKDPHSEEARGTIPLIWSINFHPWHISYNIGKARYLRNSEVNENLYLLQQVIDFLSSIYPSSSKSITQLLMI